MSPIHDDDCDKKKEATSEERDVSRNNNAGEAQEAVAAKAEDYGQEATPSASSSSSSSSATEANHLKIAASEAAATKEEKSLSEAAAGSSAVAAGSTSNTTTRPPFTRNQKVLWFDDQEDDPRCYFPAIIGDMEASWDESTNKKSWKFLIRYTTAGDNEDSLVHPEDLIEDTPENRLSVLSKNGKIMDDDSTTTNIKKRNHISSAAAPNFLQQDPKRPRKVPSPSKGLVAKNKSSSIAPTWSSSPHQLPKGIYAAPKGRYYAQSYIAGRNRHFGTYDTKTKAIKVQQYVLQKLKQKNLLGDSSSTLTVSSEQIQNEVVRARNEAAAMVEDMMDDDDDYELLREQENFISSTIRKRPPSKQVVMGSSPLSTKKKKKTYRSKKNPNLQGLFRTSSGTWQTQLYFGGKCRHVGTFPNQKHAIRMRDYVSTKLGKVLPENPSETQIQTEFLVAKREALDNAVPMYGDDNDDDEVEDVASTNGDDDEDTIHANDDLHGIIQRKTGNWQVQAQFRGKTRYIGTVKTKKMAIKARDVAEDFFTTYDGSVTTDEQLHAAIAAAKEKAMQAAIQMGGSDAVATKHGGQRKKKRSSSLGGGVSTIMKRRRSSRDAPSSSEGPLGHIPGVSVTHYGTWQVQLSFLGKSRHIGTFDTQAKAASACQAARRKFKANEGIDEFDASGIEGVMRGAKRAAAAAANGERVEDDYDPRRTSNARASKKLMPTVNLAMRNHALSKRDVIIGPGNATIIEFGRSKRVCTLVEKYQPSYTKAKRKNAEQFIALEIVQHIKDKGGSFVKLTEDLSTITTIQLGAACVVMGDYIAVDIIRKGLRGEKITIPKPSFVAPVAAAVKPVDAKDNSIVDSVGNLTSKESPAPAAAQRACVAEKSEKLVEKPETNLIDKASAQDHASDAAIQNDSICEKSEKNGSSQKTCKNTEMRTSGRAPQPRRFFDVEGINKGAPSFHDSANPEIGDGDGAEQRRETKDFEAGLLKQAATATSSVADIPLECDIVLECDRELLSEYTFFVMQQYRRCQFSESDKSGSKRGPRANLNIGHGGFQCIHCADKPKARKFFPTTIDTMVSAFSDVLSHPLNCQHCPPAIKDKLFQLKTRNAKQSAQLPRGSRKIFYKSLWRRLHEMCSLDDSKRV